ncbi:MAG TPA: AraC family transcriptional regulator [Thermoanaerobaculia bacterium]|nr:AraC family transcriptional regulator [Thermoanaerobaculia bacterium]
MTRNLARNEFFGVRVAARQLGGFALSLTRYSTPSLPWHGHEEAYLTFVISGRYRERLRGGARDCLSRALVLHPAGEHHADEFASRAAVCLNLHFDRSWLRALATRGDSFERSAVLFTPSTSAIGARLAREFRRNDDLSPIAVEGLLLELFAETARSSASGARAPAWLRKAHAIVTARFAAPPTLRTLAAEVSVHPVHLARAFRQHYGCTVGDLVRDLRVAFARERIRSGCPLATIATEAGFADQSHFTRTFRVATGMTPAEFRRV